jgi:ABC-type glutathione transport system ATPase component
MSHHLETTLSEAAGKNLSAAATLEWLADMELEARRGRAIERRFKCSKLQIQPSIDTFHFAHHKSRSQNKNRVLRLLDLSFIANGTNLVLIGNPGVGKTFLSKIVGWRACQSNQRVLLPLPWTCSITYSPHRSITPSSASSRPIPNRLSSFVTNLDIWPSTNSRRTSSIRLSPPATARNVPQS